jgi:hypothetical protein
MLVMSYTMAYMDLCSPGYIPRNIHLEMYLYFYSL